MRKVQCVWPNTKYATNLVFFAQSLHEMVYDHSADSHRAKALDSLDRLHELQSIGNLVDQGIIPPEALTPVVKEATWSLEKDLVVKEIIGSDVEHYNSELRSTESNIEKIKIARHVHQAIKQSYKSVAERLIEEHIERGKKDELYSVTQIYCSHLISSGYERRYILSCIKDYFFTKDRNRVDKRLIKNFLKNFSGEQHKFIVHCKAKKSFAKYINDLVDYKLISKKNEIPKSFHTKELGFFKNIQPEKVIIELPAIQSKDRFGARDIAHSVLSNARSLLFLTPSSVSTKFDEVMFVHIKGTRKGNVVGRSTLPLERRLKVPATAALEDIKKTISAEFDKASIDRIVRSLNNASLSTTNSNKENQLISIWSAIEAFIAEPEREKGKGKNRINHYVRLMLPCISSNYAGTLITSLYGDLKRAYHDDFNEIVGSIRSGINDKQKFALLLSMDGEEPLPQRLVSLCSENPLAHYRLIHAHKKIKSPKKILSSLVRHEELVDWQIRRIYRARNDLVHNGENSHIIDTLLLNLDDYYRSLIMSVRDFALSHEGSSNIDDVMCSVGIEYRKYKKMLGNALPNDEFRADELFAWLRL